MESGDRPIPGATGLDAPSGRGNADLGAVSEIVRLIASIDANFADNSRIVTNVHKGFVLNADPCCL